jgi:hypothetical protein
VTDLNRINSSNLDAFTSAGVPALANRDTGAFTTWGVTLAANTTYLFPLGSFRAAAPGETLNNSVHLWGKTAGLIITSANIDDTNVLPFRSPDGRGDAVLTDFDITNTGAWIPETPSNADVRFVGTGWSASGGIVTAAGTGVGGAMFLLGNMASLRKRLRVVVGATGGTLQVAMHGVGGA